MVLMSAVSKAVWMAAMTERVTVVSKVDNWAVKLAAKKAGSSALRSAGWLADWSVDF